MNSGLKIDVVVNWYSPVVLLFLFKIFEILFEYSKPTITVISVYLNPKTGATERRSQFEPLPVVFRKMYLLKKGWNTGFWWLLILSWVTCFLKIPLKFLQSFRKYEEFLNNLSILAIFIGFHDFFWIFDISLLQRN